MKSAFSFIEVIISVVILSYLGVALLNFNSFNKSAMEQNIGKQNTLFVSTPLLYTSKEIKNDKKNSIYDFVSFKNLTDEDSLFLKSIEVKREKSLEDKLFLYTDGKKDHYLHYANTKVTYKNYKNINFILIENEK